jgi:CSLREA domain-containing protein
LRAALQEALSQGGASTLTFSVSGTLSLTYDLPYISGGVAITVTGPGQDQLILQPYNQPPTAARAFTVTAGNTLSLSGLTLTKFASGALYTNGGNLNITNCLITANSGSLYNPSPAISIYGRAGVNITGSTISNNGGEGGNAIYISSPDNTPQINITSSTFVNNTNILGDGGAIAKYGGTLNLVNSTLVNNSANYYGGAIYNAQGPVFISNSTIFGNAVTRPGDGKGGGIYSASSTSPNTEVTLKNTIIAGNTSAGYAPNIMGYIISAGYNLQGSLDLYSTNLNGSGDLTVNDDEVFKAEFSPLSNNGGPTQTILPLAANPAINNGNPSGCTDQSGVPITTDQRGISLPQGGRCDIGAVEVVGLLVNSAADTDDGLCDAANCTLREALNLANTPEVNKVIFFNLPGGPDQTILLDSGQPLPPLASSILLDGLSPPGATCVSATGQVEINGNGLDGNGLVLTGGSTVKGLNISNFKGRLIPASSENGSNLIWCVKAKKTI